jgi:hypothetical protein
MAGHARLLHNAIDACTPNVTTIDARSSPTAMDEDAIKQNQGHLVKWWRGVATEKESYSFCVKARVATWFRFASCDPSPPASDRNHVDLPHSLPIMQDLYLR